SGSARAAIDGILSAALAPEALLGALAMALAGVAMGWILSTRHLSLALLGALVWTAGLEGLLATVGDGGLAGRPLILASAALLAVFVAFARRDGAMRPAAPALPASPNGQPGHGWSGRLA
ncbi:MAG: hypothetical protein H0W09_08460, partial [Solirubrobacterales bacterium]|nr:hypothetical protein [Solirubrobacterales bacterium]